MSFAAGFLMGIFAGVAAGYMIAALMFISAESDRRRERSANVIEFPDPRRDQK